MSASLVRSIAVGLEHAKHAGAQQLDGARALGQFVCC